MTSLSVSNILLVAVFVVPGAVSIFVYRLLEPAPDRTLKDVLIEAVTASVINFVILFLPIYYAVSPATIETTPYQTWLILVVCLFVAPMIWPILLLRLLKKLDKHQIVFAGSKTAWDEFFARHAIGGCWVIVHLTDGCRIGGRMSRHSYASAFPREGHLYIQELWEVDAVGNFVDELPGPQGALLRPGDYHYLRVVKPEHDYG